MVTLQTLDVSVISFVLLIVIIVHSINRLERFFPQYRLFHSLVVLCMVLIAIDICSWVFNGLPGQVNLFANVVFNLLLYISAPVVPAVWVLYVLSLIYRNDAQPVKVVKLVLLVILAANALIALVSLKTGWFFTVDSSNIYHRGNFFLLHVLVCELLLGLSFIFVLIKRTTFQKRQFWAMVLFFIAPLAGTLIQAFHYGVSYNWAGVTLSLLIIYLNFQSRSLSTDYLTGVSNRRHLQRYITAKIRSTSSKRTFGAVMLDIDDFKHINDTYGHAVGDDALRHVARILKDSLRRDDVVARFGGDEFLIVIDVQTRKTLEEAIERIVAKTTLFNSTSATPYKLSFSMGYALYDVAAKPAADDFMCQLDRLMYDNKAKRGQIVGADLGD